MGDTVKLIDPGKIDRNPENPRLIFHQEELETLQESIAEQGILVPLTVFKEKKGFRILDGERRWRCALKLGLTSVPVIIQPKPGRMENIMMMFAIHNARKDWDPLPTAKKLEELEAEFFKRNGRTPTEKELSGIASLAIGMIRRLKKLLSLPIALRDELMAELEKPRQNQEITVDQVLEATKGAEALRKKSVINVKEEEELRSALIDKFRKKVIINTVSPRKLVKIARAVERNDVTESNARKAITRLKNNPTYTIDQAFQDTVEQEDYEHGTEQLAERLISRLEEHNQRGYKLPEALLIILKRLAKYIKQHM
jgi:ParB family transcriptional regulator, chromosome partitioning protein